MMDLSTLKLTLTTVIKAMRGNSNMTAILNTTYNSYTCLADSESNKSYFYQTTKSIGRMSPGRCGYLGALILFYIN